MVCICALCTLHFLLYKQPEKHFQLPWTLDVHVKPFNKWISDVLMVCICALCISYCTSNLKSTFSCHELWMCTWSQPFNKWISDGVNGLHLCTLHFLQATWKALYKLSVAMKWGAPDHTHHKSSAYLKSLAAALTSFPDPPQEEGLGACYEIRGSDTRVVLWQIHF